MCAPLRCTGPSLVVRQEPPYHPDLRSFPTRRSSDLADHRQIDAQRHRHRAHLPRRGGGRSRRGAANGRDVGEDRKSTRLNSSHLGISYAVFCLKKKNTTTTERSEEVISSPRLNCDVI